MNDTRKGKCSQILEFHLVSCKTTIARTTMKKRSILFNLLLALRNTFCTLIVLPSYNSRSSENHKVMPLTSSVSGKAVLVTTYQPYSVSFCLRKRSTVSIQNLRLSNFNHSALFNVSADNTFWFGTYYASPDTNWNNFENTGRFPNTHVIDSGWHVLKIYLLEHQLSTPGIALDNIALEVDDPWINLSILECQTVCIESGIFPLKSPKLSEVATTANIRQKSYRTQCAEVDNVEAAIFNPDIDSFLITASLPQYKTSSNYRKENLTNCPHLDPNLWTFPDISFDTFSRETLQGRNAVLIIIPVSNTSVLVEAKFWLEGQSQGSIDAKIGSLLKLKFKRVSSFVSIRVRYRNKWGNMSVPETHIFSPSRLTYTWKIPDFTWTETKENFISLTIQSLTKERFELDYLTLQKRPFKPERHVTIYKSDDVHIVAGFVEMWWLAPQRMRVRLSNGHVHEGISYIQFYRPVPWSKGYSQVFVMYQDGNARLVPTPPEGYDWIPFGTSVIIGQPQMDSVRPYASVKQLDIFPERFEIHVYYRDGGSVRLRLNTSLSETRAYVDKIQFTRDKNTHPFATVRSMYVAEGNNDVDSIKVDNNKTYHILDEWGSIRGKSFAFYRKCISKHLTLSPDIQIDVLATKSVLKS